MNQLSLQDIDDFLIQKKITLSPLQKDFLFIFFQTNSLTTTKNYLNISLEDVVKIYKDPLIQDILRILQLHRHREIFKMKMLNLEEIGSYLSNQLLDLNLGEADRLTPKEKLEATKLLLDVHTKLNNSIQNPIELDSYQILDMQLKNLSISTIKSLLNSDKKNSLSQSSNSIDNSDNSNQSHSFQESILLNTTPILNNENQTTFLKGINKKNVEVLNEISKQTNTSILREKKEQLDEKKKKIKNVISSLKRNDL